MRSKASWLAVLLAVSAAASGAFPTVAAATVRSADAQGLGTWRSAEQFEGESRLSFAFKRHGDGIVGWAVLLGQHRKTDDRATLALTFYGVKPAPDGLRFETLLPEDEGTIGWELRVTSPNRATLVAVTEDGQPMTEDLRWEMTK